MQKLKSVCVFGGTTIGNDEEFLKAAVELGKTLAAKKISVVYGGGIHGLTGSMAGSAIIGGNHVMSIVLKYFADRNPPSLNLGTEIRVSSVLERIVWMLYNADAFIALPGGLGTLEEVFCITSWANLSFHKKPLGLLNINGFYDDLLSFLDKAVEQGFITQASRSMIKTTSTVDELINMLHTSVPEPITEERHGESSRKRKLDTTLRL